LDVSRGVAFFSCFYTADAVLGPMMQIFDRLSYSPYTADLGFPYEDQILRIVYSSSVIPPTSFVHTYKYTSTSSRVLYSSVFIHTHLRHKSFCKREQPPSMQMHMKYECRPTHSTPSPQPLHWYHVTVQTIKQACMRTKHRSKESQQN
jgi:hypothetical protein